jgi:hypothetical protein
MVMDSRKHRGLPTDNVTAAEALFESGLRQNKRNIVNDTKPVVLNVSEKSYDTYEETPTETEDDT